MLKIKNKTPIVFGAYPFGNVTKTMVKNALVGVTDDDITILTYADSDCALVNVGDVLESREDTANYLYFASPLGDLIPLPAGKTYNRSFFGNFAKINNPNA